MPASTLWRAMRSERRPMRIASATRSMRSTMITTSAASDEAVAPAPPIAMPTSASASAGASLTPSPTIDHRAQLPGAHRAHDLELVLGAQLGVDAVDADARPTASATGAPVAGRPSRRARTPLRVQRGDSGDGVVAQAVGHHDRAGQPCRRRRRGPAARPRVRRRPRRSPRRAPQAAASARPALPTATRAALDAALDALRRAARHVRRGSQAAGRGARRRARAPRPGRGPRAGRAMRRAAAARRLDARRADTMRSTSGAPSVSVPVLSSSTVRARPSCSIDAGALDDHADARGAREPGHERDRRGEDERARRGDHEHGERAHRIPAERPGAAGEQRA